MTTSQPDFLFNRPGALIAALPAVLGFVPEKSLVLVALDRGELGPVIRADLSTHMTDTIAHIAEVAAAARPDAAIAVIVDALGAQCAGCVEDFREFTAELTEALAAQGIVLIATHVVDRIAAGGRWHCADCCGAAGAVEDPTASPLAMAAVLDGRRLYARRQELQAVVATDDAARCERLAGLIAERLRAAAGAQPEDADRARRNVEQAIAVAGKVADGAELSDDQLIELACALTDIRVRDTLYALAVGENAAQAEALWGVLSRALPEPWRVEPLVLLAFSAYARGDGPLAGVALEAALRGEDEHRMAGMLDAALQSGLRPEQIRELAATGYLLAARLGVQLPPRREFGRRAG
ncbi:DUF4192 domain-containing protein [Mycobacterium sp.]|uniref:DUF4192 domain-containing protein n=1 Tax=Mycobacterium sp. TaxID=1785 RepID=UPI002CB4EC04|nr:DUF4192 domain-containing protein [Mycobacterium sp.]HME48024.1 DUF4192 domain-containing protein [Mycobacterium sp.]